MSPQKASGGIQKSFKFIDPQAATSGISQGTDVCEIMFCAPGADGSEGILNIENNEPACSSEGSGEINDDSKQITIKIT